MSERSAPPNLKSLDRRIRNLAAKNRTTLVRLRQAVANTAIGQMLPPGVVKGGTALKLRIGEGGSRFSADVDASRKAESSLDDYIGALGVRLNQGWGGFTGRVLTVPAPEPAGVPDEYVMQPFDIKLQYLEKPLITVRFELGHDEIGSTSKQDLRLADDLLMLFETLGLETPSPIPVLAIEHQVAQKLHACTSVGIDTGTNLRAHDLVDLQLLDQDEGIDPEAVGPVAIRLFAARKSHSWPPTVVAYPGWESIYGRAAKDLDVIPEVSDAVDWTNSLISKMPK